MRSHVSARQAPQPASSCILKTKSMRMHLLASRVAHSWRQLVRRAEALYLRRTYRQVCLWRLLGSSLSRPPHVPWWAPLLYRFLVLVGRLPYQRRLPWGAARPVVRPSPGARVYLLRRV